MLLTKAQHLLGQRVIPVIDNTWDLTWNPARLVVRNIRKLAFYGFSDMFYYVSTDGKKSRTFRSGKTNHKIYQETKHRRR